MSTTFRRGRSGLYLPTSSGGGGAYSVEVLADSPLMWLKCDETSGTTAADSSGNSHPGTINGTPTLNQTKVRPGGAGSILLNANTKYIAVPNGSWMNVSAWTVEAWVRFSALGSGYQNIVNRDGDSTHRGWNLYSRSQKMNAFVAASGNPTDHLGSTLLAGATNYHVAMSSNGTAVKLYLNGVLDGTFTTAVGVNAANALLIGASYAGTASPTLTGTAYVQDVAYYGTELTSTRIAAHVAAG